MDYQVEMTSVTAQPVLAIKGKARIEQAGDAIGAILGQVAAYLQSKEAQPTGAPFTRTFNFENGVLEFESGFPVAAKVIGNGEIIRTELPAGVVATTTHTGSQDDSPAAYAAIQNWMATNKKKEAGAPWEIYLTDAESTEPAEGEMQVFFPILD